MAAAESVPGDDGARPASRTLHAPPRPRLTVRVGITGHRWDKLDPAHRPALVTQLRAVLQHIHRIADGIADDPEGGYRPPYLLPGDPHPLRPELRMLSALAEGADRLMVDAAPKGWRLQALLPFPEAVYRRDFAPVPPGEEDPFTVLLDRARAEAGVVVLDGNREDPNAFEPVGTLLCLNSDVLIAVWNGLPSVGRGRGGTATIVQLGRQLGIPIVRVAPDAGVPPWLDTGVDHPPAAGGSLGGLDERLRRNLAAPPSPYVEEEDGQRQIRRDFREEYFREGRVSGWRGHLYSISLRLLNLRLFGGPARRESWRDLGRAVIAPFPSFRRGGRQQYGDGIRQRWRRQWLGELGLPEAFVEPLLATPLADHYGWSSRLAAHHAGRYRGAFLLGYALSWIAVGFGAAGLAAGSAGSGGEALASAMGFYELLTLLAIVFVVARARRRKHHERWLEYRQITEALRPLSYALPAARTAIRRIGRPGERDSWVDWLHRAVVREAGLYPAVMTPDHLQCCRRLLIDGELREQIRYHKRNAVALSLAGRRLHRIANWIFWLALALSLYHLFEPALGPEHHPFLGSPVNALGILGITIPAIASAIHGFVSQAEFEESAQRSRTTARRLEALCEAGTAPDFPVTSAAVGDLVAESAGAMGEEVGAWFATYHGKGVSLP